MTAANEPKRLTAERRSADVAVWAAELTGSGRGGVATIGVAGRHWHSLIGHCFAPAAGVGELHTGRVYYGRWHGGDPAAPGESVVVTPLGDRGAEVHCHGGRAAVAAILDDLATAGAKVIAWPQWMVEQEGAPLLISEAQQVLVETATARTAAIALDQVRGALQNQGLGWINALQRDADWPDVRTDVERVLRRSDVGMHLSRSWNVVLAGPPNVGKSSLLNALLGYRRAITFDAPGTTRDVVAAETVIDGWPLRISDTAGMRRSDDRIERSGVRSARRAAQQADLVIRVADASQRDHGKGMDAWDAVLESQPARSDQRVIQVLNKVDLLGAAEQPLGDQQVATVATERRGIDTLSQRIIEVLVPHVPPPGAAVPITRRQVDCLRDVVAARSAAQVRGALHALLQG